jgi:threonine dehydrogenase-like Zn-dependent dehydrogenase
MASKPEAYRAAAAPIPSEQWAWQLFGAGMDKFGIDGRPVRIPVPQPGPGELLLRVDACGLCFSDIKIINLGGDHPRLTGRDLQRNPVIPGHEASLTVVRIGPGLENRYHVGDRFIVQADIRYKGKGVAFGYALPGALQQYVLVGDEVLRGDDGCYLLPVQPTTGNAEAGLAEPWACVERSYRVTYRGGIKHEGVALFLGADRGAPQPVKLSWGIEPESYPGTIVIDKSLTTKVRRFISEQAEATDAEVAEVFDADLPALSAKFADGAGFDDVVIIGAPAPAVAESAAKVLAPGGVLSIVAAEPMTGPAQIDVGRIHYDGLQIVGTMQSDIAAGYKRSRTSELRTGGSAWFVGAGGPMGQMHVLRAAEMAEGPRVIVGSDIDAERLTVVHDRFAPAAEARGARLICLNPAELGTERFDAALREACGDDGFDDICILAPVPALMEAAMPWLALNGTMNIFAGVAKGTMATLDLNPVCQRGVRFVGTSGSQIADLQYTLSKAESGKLSTNASVAAIGGIEATYEGLEGVRSGRFLGKVVIFPQLQDLPLTTLQELPERLPSVAAKLKDGKAWTRDAEAELFDQKLPH